MSDDQFYGGVNDGEKAVTETPMTGRPVAGTPVAGVPVAGVPAAGAPVGVSAGGTPAAGVHMATNPAGTAGGFPPRMIPNGFFRRPMNRIGITLLIWVLAAQVVGTLALMIPMFIRIFQNSAVLMGDPGEMIDFLYGLLAEIQTDPLYLGLVVLMSPLVTLLAVFFGSLLTKVKLRSLFRQRDMLDSERLGAGSFINIAFIVLACAGLGQILVALVELWMRFFNLTFVVPEFLQTLPSFDQPLYMMMTIFGMCIGAPVAEELLFRGVILQALRPYGNSFAIVVSSLLFALVHGNLFQLPGPFLLGMIFAVVTLHTRSVLPAILLHAINNTFAILIEYLAILIEYLLIPLQLPEIVAALIIWGCYAAFILIAILFSVFNQKNLKPFLKTWRLKPAPFPAAVQGGAQMGMGVAGVGAASVSFVQWQRRFKWFWTSWGMQLAIWILVALFFLTMVSLLVPVQ